jgi:hypothetical protein
MPVMAGIAWSVITKSMAGVDSISLMARTRIPTDDAPGRIQHVGGIIRDAVDEQLKAALAFLQTPKRGLELAGTFFNLSFHLSIELPLRIA